MKKLTNILLITLIACALVIIGLLTALLLKLPAKSPDDSLLDTPTQASSADATPEATLPETATEATQATRQVTYTYSVSAMQNVYSCVYYDTKANIPPWHNAQTARGKVFVLSQCPKCGKEDTGNYYCIDPKTLDFSTGNTITFSENNSCWDCRWDYDIDSYMWVVVITREELTEPIEAETSPTTTETNTSARETIPETTPETAPPTQPSNGAVPYLFDVKQAGYPIYNGPSYDCTLVSSVSKPGIYTIVEEAWDEDGRLWGRLKSGVGWINLTDNGNANSLISTVTAERASEYLLTHGSYLSVSAANTEYAVAVAFRAESTVTDFNLLSVSFVGDGYAINESVYSLPSLTRDQPLVAWIDFPGDMSAWAISYVDSTGAKQYRLVYLSLKDGSLVMDDFYP